jgi:hypothetical protein
LDTGLVVRKTRAVSHRATNGLRRWIAEAALAMVFFGAVLASPAGASDIFALYGAGDEPLRPGLLAAEAQFTEGLDSLAVRADGVVAFAVGRSVYWIENGRLERVPAPRALFKDVAFGQDGSLLVTSCPSSERPGAVYSAAPGRVPLVVAGGGKAGGSGDGGPATAATLECPSAVAVDAGGILIAEFAKPRVRRVSADGVISTVAGTGVVGRSGDGGPATRAQLSSPADLAALPGGGFAILDAVAPDELSGLPSIRTVDANGVIRTLREMNATDLAAAPDGAVLVSDEGNKLRRVGSDGSVSAPVDMRRDSVGIPSLIPVAGDPFGSDQAYVGTIARSPDGGLLFDASFAIQYLPPAAPALLGLAILPATRVPAQRLSVAIRTTLAADVQVGVWRHGRRAASVQATVPGGDAAIPIPVHLPGGDYQVRVRATAGGQVAAAHADVLVGGLLPVAYARSFVRNRLDLLEIFQDVGPFRIACRRVARGRVDCGLRQGRRCAGIVTVRVRADGTLRLTARRAGGRCR